MLVYKCVNVFGGNLTDKYVDANKVNDMAKDNWKLIAITAPPNSQNNRWVSGTFVRDEATAAKIATVEISRQDVGKTVAIEKKPVGRPPKEPKIAEPEVK